MERDDFYIDEWAFGEADQDQDVTPFDRPGRLRDQPAADDQTNAGQSPTA